MLTSLLECGDPRVRYIQIKIPDIDALTTLNLREDIVYFDGTNYWLTLFIDENDYDPIQTGEGTELKQTANGWFISRQLMPKGFNAKFTYTETNIRIAIMRIARYHAINNTITTIIDTVSPEEKDFELGYTIRQGIIKSPITYKGASHPGSTYSANGFTFTFMEKANYYV